MHFWTRQQKQKWKKETSNIQRYKLHYTQTDIAKKPRCSKFRRKCHQQLTDYSEIYAACSAEYFTVTALSAISAVDALIF